MLPRQVGHAPRPGAVQGLRLRDGLAFGAQEGEVLGEADEAGAARGGGRDEPLRAVEVALDLRRRGHLHGRGQHGVGHQRARLRRARDPGAPRARGGLPMAKACRWGQRHSAKTGH